jgi:antitoxin (DNA-binding transcriptional repressor) of toxin-antitoxin stability system
MMAQKTFDIDRLSDNLPDLLSDIQNHVEVTITCQGVPWARILPLTSAKPVGDRATLVSRENALEPRVAGFWQGQVKIADDFDDTSEEVLAAFYGED